MVPCKVVQDLNIVPLELGGKVGCATRAFLPWKTVDIIGTFGRSPFLMERTVDAFSSSHGFPITCAAKVPKKEEEKQTDYDSCQKHLHDQKWIGRVIFLPVVIHIYNQLKLLDFDWTEPSTSRQMSDCWLGDRSKKEMFTNSACNWVGEPVLKWG